jgi:hypothetical protein
MSIDPFDHPAFSFEPAGENERLDDIARRLFAEGGRFHSGPTETVVSDGYSSPYLFGQLLRQMVEDDSVEICRAGRIYFAWSGKGLAIYDPAKRPDAQPQIDWFAAAGDLAARPDDLITQSEAAELVGKSLPAVNAAVRDGRITGYNNPAATNPRRGGTLVSRADVLATWPREGLS